MIAHVPAPGDVLMREFGPDPRSIIAPGVMTGPLAVPPEIYNFRPVAVFSTLGKLSIVVPFSTLQSKILRQYHVHIHPDHMVNTAVVANPVQKPCLESDH